MSSRTQTRSRAAGDSKFFVILTLLAAMALVDAGMRSASAQDERDPKSPLPPIRTQKAIAIEKNRAIFLGRLDAKGNPIPNTGIVDFRPIATEQQNSDEYQAWTAVVLHARQFTNDEIDHGAARDLTRDDLTTVIEGIPQFTRHRLEPVRLEGRMTRVRRVEGSKSLRFEGTEELYEVLFVPVAEPMPPVWEKTLDHTVSIVFAELPAALAAVKEKPAGEWMEADHWVAAAGFFFKVMQDAAGEPAIPVLVGRSVTILPGEPFAPGANPAALDRNLHVFRRIENDAAFARGHNDWEEVSAWNRVLLHARRFSTEDLERYAAAVSFKTLFEDGYRELEHPGSQKTVDYQGQRDYKLDLVRFEGRLVMLKAIKPSAKLVAAGIETVYEGWIVPRDEPSGNPICVAFTEPPEGVEPAAEVNQWVTFAGYAFKLLRYESREPRKDDPKRYVTKRAPFLLGRGVIPRPDPEREKVSWNDFVTVAVIVIVGLSGFAIVAGWWFRRGDRLARRAIEEQRGKNPFAEPSS